MTFVEFIDGIYPVHKMPGWLISAYKHFILFSRKCLNIFSPSMSRDRPYLPWLWWVLSKKQHGSAVFTVATPVYNTGRYLDTYFQSLVRQTLDFKRHLRVIMVDDGSTDNSAEIIKKWQKRYPENIDYIYLEHQGINRARNEGLLRARTPWITWIDSDDFLHPHYFHEIDKLLKLYAKSRIVMLACRMLTYYDATGEFKDNRPFRRFFVKDVALRPHNDLEDFLHFAVNAAIFSTDEIRRQGIRFALDSDWRIFDDTHFVLRYLGDTRAGHVLFSRGPRYYYRKRDDSTSNIDIASTRRQTYIEVLEEGLLDVLKHFTQKLGFVPRWVQNSILYHMSWKIKSTVASPKNISHLTIEEKEKFLKLSGEVFSYIDRETIYDFPVALSGFKHFYQLGACHVLKGEEVESPYAYIEDYDRIKGLLKFRTFCSSLKDSMSVRFDGAPVEPVFSKAVKHKFLECVFIYEHYQWIKFGVDYKVETITCTRENTRLSLDLGGKMRPDWSGDQIALHFKRITAGIRKASPSAPWILIDRDVVADDNAEHLYRYIAEKHPNQPVCFALRRSSPCWKRLKREGFNLVEFGSRKYEKMLRQTPKLVSSHMDNHIVSYKPGIMAGKRYIYLKHGVLINDRSAGLNTKKIDLFIACTQKEYDSILENGSCYKVCGKEVALTGLPRHDALLKSAKAPLPETKTILIMPTWRNYLLGAGKGKTHARALLPDFLDSRYAKAWLSLLNHERLSGSAARHGFKIIFYPHFGMQEYFNDLKINPAIEVLTLSRTTVQPLFLTSAFMITDYSSAAFEMAFLRKSVVYYQFDEEEFFKGSHVCTRGYFDYRRDGFGPVCTDETELLNELDLLMMRDGQPVDEYRERMEGVFPLRDGNNCERVYQAIKALDVPV